MCRYILSLLVLVIASCVLGIILSYGSLWESDPPKFRVYSGRLEQFNHSKDQGDLSLSINVANPNSYSRIYSQAVKAEVFYMNDSLALDNSSLDAFTVECSRRTLLKPSVLVDFGDNHIDWNRSDHGTVELRVAVSGLIKFESKNAFFRLKWKPLKVVCQPLRFESGILVQGLECIT